MRKVYIKPLILLICYGSMAVYSGVLAAQVITIPLSDSYTEGKVKICIYANAQRTETIQIDSYQKCKAVLTVESD